MSDTDSGERWPPLTWEGGAGAGSPAEVVEAPTPSWPQPDPGRHRTEAAPTVKRGLWGGLVAALGAFLKYGVLLLKLGAFKGTLITMAISVVVYSLFFGPVFAIGFVLLLLVHEMGHYVVARRMGQRVGAPVFIPLLGALINMRQQPRSVSEEATMALAGPLVGTAASWACLVPALLLHQEFWAALGYLGCLINLFNLIPATPLDGGRVSAAISKWANLVGLLVLAGYALWSFSVAQAASPVLLIIMVFAIFGTISRFRQARFMPQYLSVPTARRWAFLGLYLGLVLVAVLGVISGNTYLQHVHQIVG